jgi:hypothetical protein
VDVHVHEAGAYVRTALSVVEHDSFDRSVGHHDTTGHDAVRDDQSAADDGGSTHDPMPGRPLPDPASDQVEPMEVVRLAERGGGVLLAIDPVLDLEG